MHGLQEKSSQQKAIINVKINKMEVRRNICGVKLEPSTRKLRSAIGQLMKLAGHTTVNV